MTGHVYIVGAGCGDGGLITVRGRDLLASCDVVIYDDLIDRALLDLAPAAAERIPVGKRAGALSAKQADINALLVEKAREGKTVVRLKGGDPFVFGRGGEEALALGRASIAYTIVPGVSSALYIPMEAGIPVTHRGVSRSVHIVTAHTAENPLPENIPELARLDGTLVFLMGLHAMERLSEELIQAGKSPHTPAAVLSGGNSPHPAAVRGTLADIPERVKNAGVLPPAVFVVGAVAGMDLRSPQPPEITVGLTGTEEFQEKLARLISRNGFKTCRVQRAKCQALAVDIPWDGLNGKWLVFTSSRGVGFFFHRLADAGADVRRLHNCKFAVIGSATGKALASHGIRADLCPEKFTGEALADALLATLRPGEEIVLFDSAKGSGVIPDKLGEAGFFCRRLSLYDTAYETVCSAKPSYILLGSAGAVNALADSGYEIGGGTVPVCIGPVSAAAFRRRYPNKPLMPEEITAESMAEAVIKHAIRNSGWRQ